MPHSLVAINFKVEYSATIPTKPHPKVVSYVIGWYSFLPDLS